MENQTMRLGELLARWRRAENKLEFFETLRQQSDPARLATAMALNTNERELDWLLTFFSRVRLTQSNLDVKTIGIYYQRFFNGGVERFLSMIIPIYVRMGYRVVFFTDVRDEKREYALDTTNVVRIVFRSESNDAFARLTELKEYIERYEIDLFCSHSPVRVLPLIFFFKLLGKPFVLGLHGVFTSYVATTHRLLQPCEFNHRIFRMADGLVVLSRVFETFWKNLGCNAYYIPNPIPNEVADFKRNSLQNRRTILWVGRVVEVKGVRELIPIMREVVKHLPDAKLLVLGGGDKRVFEEMQLQIEDEHLERNIEFLGYHREVREFYAAADVMLSTSPAEGFSLTIAESKMFSLPLVSYSLPYLELLRDKRGCLNVRQGDFRAAASAIVTLFRDDRMRTRLSLEARSSIEPFLNYDFESAWRRVFEDAINGRRPNKRDFDAEQIELLLMNEIWRRDRDRKM